MLSLEITIFRFGISFWYESQESIAELWLCSWYLCVYLYKFKGKPALTALTFTNIISTQDAVEERHGYN